MIQHTPDEHGDEQDDEQDEDNEDEDDDDVAGACLDSWSISSC